MSELKDFLKNIFKNTIYKVVCLITYFFIFILFYFLIISNFFLFANKEKKTIFWGTDLESAIPHIFKAPWDLNRVVGFEKDLVETLALYLNKKSIMCANSWDGLISGLRRKMYDVVLCGIEITKEHKNTISLSIPYYITHHQLLVHKDSKIVELNSCKNYSACKIGILRNTQSNKLIYQNNNINILYYPSEVHALMDLLSKRIDGFVIDYPIAKYYSIIDNNIKLTGRPISIIKYAIAIRKGDSKNLFEINNALSKIIYNGDLHRIMTSWNMWNNAMDLYSYKEIKEYIISYNYNMFINFFKYYKHKSKLISYLNYLPILLKGALITMQISIFSILIAIVVGFFLAIIKIYAPFPFYIFSNLYIEIVRGTPLLMQLYFIFYGLPYLGIVIGPFISGIFTLGLHYAAFEAENYRSGILAIPKGQIEAAIALGMNQVQAIRFVILPQAFRIILPSLINDFLSLLKDSSLVSVITIIDLTFAYNMLATTYFSYFGIGILVAFIYLIMGFPFIQIAKYYEKKII